LVCYAANNELREVWGRHLCREEALAKDPFVHHGLAQLAIEVDVGRAMSSSS